MNSTRGELRSFGLVMATATAVIAGVLTWRDRGGALVGVYISSAFLLSALAAPGVLAPAERLWMTFAGVLGRISTAVLLTITFYIVITPLGVLRRVFVADTLGMRADPSKDTYWVAVEPDGPATRPSKPY
jgi:hypothetical protein